MDTLIPALVFKFCSGLRLGTRWQGPICSSFLVSLCVHSVVPNSATTRMVAHQAPQSMGFYRQEFWS